MPPTPPASQPCTIQTATQTATKAAAETGAETAAESADHALRQRARRVVPGGMTGHLNAAALPPAYPQFFQRGQGCRLWAVDGREFIDFMGAWGPKLLGYRHH